MRYEQYRKLIAALVGAVVTILAVWQIDVDPEVVAAATTLLTAIGVWFFPNG